MEHIPDTENIPYSIYNDDQRVIYDTALVSNRKVSTRLLLNFESRNGERNNQHWVRENVPSRIAKS